MRTSTLSSVMIVVLLLAIPADALQTRSQRPGSPLMTNDDVWSPRARNSTADETVSPVGGSSPLRNARAVLEGALTKMSEVSSVRTRVQTSLPTGEREVLIETMKPDRTHIMSADGEMFVIGRKFYMKTGETWNVTSIPAGGAKSDLGFDFRTFVKQMMAKSNVRVTGQAVGGQMLDGVETVAYEFAVIDGRETGTIQVCVGKEDGFMRRMFLSGGALEIKIWFTNINEQFSIEAPM